MKISQLLLLVSLGTILTGCHQSNHERTFDSSKLPRVAQDEIDKVIEDFILASDGDLIEVPKGFYNFETQLILDNKKNVTIRGAGMEETVFSFRNLTTGGEGVKLSGKNILIENLSIEEPPGDGVKSQHCDGITFRKINVTWTNGDKSKNGTYAIYPVQCSNVMVDECIASHSRDAGIYVGQSENIIVKNSLVFGNVAGIEIENSDNAEVFGNTVRENTGGILVFNLPGLPKADGRGTKVYNNTVTSNNHRNFAIAEGESPNGNAITTIPPGSGIILLAAKGVEVFNNSIHGNKTVGLAIASYQITGFPAEGPNWSPYSSDIHIYNNSYKRPNNIPDLSKELGQLISMYGAHGKARPQDIIYDGFFDPSKGSKITDNPMNICLEEKDLGSLHFTRFYLDEGADKILSFKEYQPFICKSEISKPNL